MHKSSQCDWVTEWPVTTMSNTESRPCQLYFWRVKKGNVLILNPGKFPNWQAHEKLKLYWCLPTYHHPAPTIPPRYRSDKYFPSLSLEIIVVKCWWLLGKSRLYVITQTVITFIFHIRPTGINKWVNIISNFNLIKNV